LALVSPRLISRRRLGGGAVMEPEVVGDDAAVGDPAVSLGDQPGDGAFDWGPPSAVFVLPDGVGGSLVAGCGEQFVLGVDVEVAPGLGVGAASAQGAVDAEAFELGGGAVRLDLPEVGNVSGRAGRGAGRRVDAEVVDGEAAGDGLPQRWRLEHQGVAVGLQVCAQRE
jgi:hypothetical protein